MCGVCVTGGVPSLRSRYVCISRVAEIHSFWLAAVCGFFGYCGWLAAGSVEVCYTTLARATFRVVDHLAVYL